MIEILTQFWKRMARYFVAGVLALLPLVITIAIVIWVTDFLKAFVGPDTVVGGLLANLGGNYFRDLIAPYIAGWVVVLGLVFATGVLVELGAKSIFNRIGDSVLKRIPLIGSIYSTSKQVVEMLDKKDDDALQGMSAVFCYFGKDSASAVLAFLVSPDVFEMNGSKYHIVIIPSAPLPFGGAMMFVPVEKVKPADMPVDGLMSIYLSMGISAPQYMKSEDAPPS